MTVQNKLNREKLTVSHASHLISSVIFTTFNPLKSWTTSPFILLLEQYMKNSPCWAIRRTLLVNTTKLLEKIFSFVKLDDSKSFRSASA